MNEVKEHAVTNRLSPMESRAEAPGLAVLEDIQKLSLNEDSPEKTNTTLAKVVDDWVAKHEGTSEWSALMRTKGAKEFSVYLDDLMEMEPNLSTHLKTTLAQDLDVIVKDTVLRKTLFDTVQTNHKSDLPEKVARVSFLLAQEKLIHQIKQGAYDQKLPEMLELALGLHQLTKLEKIVTEKTKTTAVAEKSLHGFIYRDLIRSALGIQTQSHIDVVHHYQNQGAGTASTEPSDINDAATLLNVEVKDLQAFVESAVDQVKRDSSNGFAEHVAHWSSPVRSVMARICPEKSTEIEAKIESESEGDAFDEKVSAWINSEGLVHNAESEKKADHFITEQVDRDNASVLLQHFLQHVNLSLPA